MANCSSGSDPPRLAKGGFARAINSGAALPLAFGWLYHMSRGRASNTPGLGLKLSLLLL